METQNIEYKRKWRDDFLEEICAFANADGGTLFVGIDDNGSIIGIDNAKQLLEDLPNQIYQFMGIVAEINLLTQEDKQYISISVPKSEQPISFRGKYYVRSGSTKQELKGTALTDFLLRQTHTTWDMSIVKDATINDIDPDAVQYFVQCATAINRLDDIAQTDSTESILRRLKLITPKGEITFAAILLFGKDIEDFTQTASFRMGRFGASQSDLILQDEVSCALIRMPEQIMQLLRSRYLVSPIHYEGMLRKEPLEIPEDAMREMICNAIVHRDYHGTFTQMRVWNDHIELWNAGVFPPEITPENLMTLHESYPRNSLIAKVFFRAGFIEAWGRGYDKIRTAFEKEHLQVPTFEQVRGGVMATIKREKFMATQTGSNVINDVNNGAKSGVNNGVNNLSQLTDRQRQIIKLLQSNPTFTTKKVAQIINVPFRTIQRDISTLQKNGCITHIGSHRLGHWEILNI